MGYFLAGSYNQDYSIVCGLYWGVPIWGTYHLGVSGCWGFRGLGSRGLGFAGSEFNVSAFRGLGLEGLGFFKIYALRFSLTVL